MGQRPPVRHQRLLRAEDRPDTVAGVVGPPLHRHGPLQHRPDALAHAPRGLCLVVPDGGEDLQHVGARHVGNQACADAGEGVASRLQARQPARCWSSRSARGGRRRRTSASSPRGVSPRAGRRPRGPACGWPAPSRAPRRAGRAPLRAAEPEFHVPAVDTSRWTQLRVPDGCTKRYNPWPSQYRPGAGGGGTRADRLRRHDGFRSGHAGAQAGAVHGRPVLGPGRFPFR